MRVFKRNTGTKESAVEKYFCEQVAAHGGEVRKVKWLGRDGAPDRLALFPYCLIWVELKRPGKKAEPHQEREHERLRAYGQQVYVIDSREAVDNLMREVDK